MRSDRIRIALQKSGRLADESHKLLKNCGLHVTRSREQLLCRISEMPIDVLMVRDDDIPQFVSSGICDLGIVGENVFAERKLEAAQSGAEFAATILERLGFSRCRLVIAVPEDGSIRDAQGLAGTVIATTYPHLLGEFLRKHGVTATPLEMTGSVEVAPRLKIADAICDIVDSGATLVANNLCEMMPVLASEALLIRSAKTLAPDREAVVARLLARMRGSLRAESSKYIMLHADKSRLPEIVKLLPGSESPTVLPLQGMIDKVAVHAVCREAVFWETMEKLEAAGASSVLVLPIEKMMG